MSSRQENQLLDGTCLGHQRNAPQMVEQVLLPQSPPQKDWHEMAIIFLGLRWFLQEKKRSFFHLRSDAPDLRKSCALHAVFHVPEKSFLLFHIKNQSKAIGEYLILRQSGKDVRY